MASSIILHSDFDNTIILPNAGAVLVRNYLLRGSPPLLHRVRMVWRVLTHYLTTQRLPTYYAILREMPIRERRRILSKTLPNPVWLAQVDALRTEFDADTAAITVVSRNCIDVIDDWLASHASLLHEHDIRIDAIVANKPLSETRREYNRRKLGCIARPQEGLLTLAAKRHVLPKKAIYIADSDERSLRDAVKRFVEV